MAQTTGYGFKVAAAQAGQIYDLRPHTIISFAAEIVIQPGSSVRRGTNPEKQVLVANATNFAGVAVLSGTLEQSYLSGGAFYKIGDTVPVMKAGAVWVTTAVAVVAGESAYVTSTGTFTNVSTSNLLVGRFETSAGINGVAVLSMPN